MSHTVEAYVAVESTKKVVDHLCANSRKDLIDLLKFYGYTAANGYCYKIIK